MKILHICLASFYIDNYSYQENLLPKFHNKMGLDVEIIASLVSFDKDGEPSLLKKSGTYSNEFGIPVTRLEYKKTVLSRRLRRYTGTYEALIKAKPDVIFIHGCQFIDIRQVVKYARQNPNVEIFVDNHADFSNSARNFLSKNVLHKIVWRYCARTIEPYTTKFYGVLPARVDFLKNIYKIPEEKIELLLMGADDEKVIEAQDDVMRIDIRKKYGIKPTDFLIMTGGKIDLAKKQTLLLMQAIKELDRKDIKLIVFGSIVEELKNEVEYLSDGEKIQYIGWIDAEDSYKYFSASDLVVFPGRHSVFWEQVVALGIPMIVKYWDGTNHIDIGGNCKFLHEDSVQEIADAIRELAKDNFKIYKCMKKSALSEEHNEFLYSSIANQSLQISNNSAGNKTQNER